MAGQARSFASNLTALGGGLALSLAWLGATTGIPAAYQPATSVAAELVAVLIAILAWRFRRGRLAVAAVIIATANHLLRGPLAGGIEGVMAPGYHALALLLPLNLGVLALVPERPLTRPSTLIHLGAVAAQVVLVSLFIHSGPSPGALEPWFELAATPQASLLAFLMAAVFTLLALSLRFGAAETALPWALASAAVSLHGGVDVAGATLVMLAAQLIFLLGLIEESYRLAFHDELTGLPGRRALNEAMADLNGTYALAMVDVDHFKRFNDRYGHDAGDQALRMVADCLRKVDGGRAYRYGGEEFTVLYTGSNVARAETSLEKLREAIGSRDFGLRAPKRPRKKPEKPKNSKSSPRRIKVTVSLGLAKPNARRSTAEQVLAAADRALYRAKKGGRDRLVSS